MSGSINESCCQQEVKIDFGVRTYVGCKIIKATPMTDVDFEKEHNLYLESKDNVNRYNRGLFIGTPVGLLTGKHLDQNQRCQKEGYKVIYPDGYVSWSPKHVFEQCYRVVSSDEKNLI